MIDEAIYSLLVTNSSGATVVAVTDTVTKGLPKVIYNLTSGPREYTNSGPVGIVAAAYQLDIFATTLLAARTIADGIRISLDGYANAGQGIIRISFPESPRPQREQTVSGQNFVVARVLLEMVVTYRETLAA